MNSIKLQYIGKQHSGFMPPVRLWNIMTPEHPAYRSTLSREGLETWGIVKGNGPTVLQAR